MFTFKSFTALASATGLASASMVEMSKNFAAALNGTTTRSLGGHLLEEYFFAYGCWCTFNDDHTFDGNRHGRGAPLDAWDANCRRLKEGYECAMIDAELRGEECVSWEVTYPTLGSGTATNIIESVCATVNSGNQCAIDVCIVETHFVNAIAEFIIPGQPAGLASLDNVNADYVHDSINFDFDAQCPAKTGMPSNEKACCGTHPERAPYKTMNRQCCPDGTLQSVGSLC